MPDICGGSSRHLTDGQTLYCLCGKVWHGPQVVPLHDQLGHPQDPEKVRVRADRADEARARKRALLRQRKVEDEVRRACAMYDILRRRGNVGGRDEQ